MILRNQVGDSRSCLSFECESASRVALINVETCNSSGNDRLQQAVSSNLVLMIVATHVFWRP
jgi:hypothetical protein